MYSNDLRAAALNIYSKLYSLRKTARLLQVSHTTVARWLGSSGIRKPYPARRTKASQIVNAIQSAIQQNPFLTSRSLASLISTSEGVSVSRELVRTALGQQGYSRKKAKFMGRPANIVAKTTDFVARRNALLQAGRQFVSVDETSFGRHGAPVYGWAAKNTPLYAKRTPCRITTTSALAAVWQDGRTTWSMRPGSFNAATFRDAMSGFGIQDGCVILLDNVSFHHSKPIRDLAAEKGWELLYVPPYSPWFNPIEGVFSVVKRAFYKGGSVAPAVAALKASHGVAFFKHAMGIQQSPNIIG